MRGKNYTESKYEPCVYYNKLLGGEYMLIAFKSRSTIDKLKKQLSFKFKMKDLGEVKKVLGIEIERDRISSKVCLTQKSYLQKVLQKFNINGDAKSVSISLTPHFNRRATMSPTIVKEREYMSHMLYVSVQ